MSQNNGNKKDPDLKTAELSGDFAMKSYEQAKLIYDKRSKLLLREDCRDTLIDAQERMMEALWNTLDQYQKRFGDVEILAEVEPLKGVKPDEYVKGLEDIILWLTGHKREREGRLPDLRTDYYRVMEETVNRIVCLINKKNYEKEEVKPDGEQDKNSR